MSRLEQKKSHKVVIKRLKTRNKRLKKPYKTKLWKYLRERQIGNTPILQRDRQ